MAFLTVDDLKASFSLFCCVYGIGTLGMPGNYAKAGPLYATIALLFMALVNVYATVVLCRCLLVVPKHVVTMGDLGEYCLGIWGRRLTVIAQFCVCLMIPTVFLVLGSQLLTTLFPDSLGPYGWTIVMAITILPVALTPTLKENAGAAFAGSFGTLLADAIALGVLGYYVKGHPQPVISPDVSFSNVISTFGNLSLAYGAAVVIPALHREHPDPRRLPKVAFVTLSFISILFVTLATVGYSFVGCQVAGNILFAIAGNKYGFTAHRSGVVLSYLAMQLHITIAFSVIAYPAFYGAECVILGLHKKSGDVETGGGQKDAVDGNDTRALEDYTREHTPTPEYISKGSIHSLRDVPIVSMADVETSEETHSFTYGERIKSGILRTSIITIMVIVACVLHDHFSALSDFVGASALCLSCIILPIFFYLKLFWKELPILEKIFGVVIISIISCLAVYISVVYFSELIHSAPTANFPYCPAKYQDKVYYNI